jgi:hypothetical protein
MRRFTAGFLALWLTGLVFVCCCGEAVEAAAESCPLAKVSEHCNKGVAAEDPTIAQLEKLPADCVDCSVLPGVFDKERRFEPNVKFTAETSFELVHEAPRPVETATARPPVTYLAPVRYLKDIHIRNRVLLI